VKSPALEQLRPDERRVLVRAIAAAALRRALADYERDQQHADGGLALSQDPQDREQGPCPSRL
jgi:hypothetical protein